MLSQFFPVAGEVKAGFKPYPDFEAVKRENDEGSTTEITTKSTTAHDEVSKGPKAKKKKKVEQKEQLLQ